MRYEQYENRECFWHIYKDHISHSEVLPIAPFTVTPDMYSGGMYKADDLQYRFASIEMGICVFRQTPTTLMLNQVQDRITELEKAKS